VIYHEKRPKILKTRETKYVEINNIVYMELYSGAKMVNEKRLENEISEIEKSRVHCIHILNTGCTKILKKAPAPKG
jgi:hypothetical protein